MAIKKIKDTEGTIHDIDAIKFGGLDPDAFVLAAGDTMTGKLSIESNSWNNQLSLKRSNNGENWGPAIEFATEGGTSAYVCVPPAKRRLASTPDGTTPTLKYYHQVGDIKNGEGINVTTSDCSATISLKSPTSTTKGGVKNGSTVTSATGYTACPIINDVVYYKDTDTDTNNDQKTSSSNKTDTKLLLVGATTASTAGQTTYTNSNCYVGTDNCLYSNGSKVLTAGDGDTKNTVGITTTSNKIYLVGATSTSTTTGASANSYTNASVYATNGTLCAFNIDATNNLYGYTIEGNTVNGDTVSAVTVRTSNLHVTNGNTTGGKIVFGDINEDDVNIHDDSHYVCIEEIDEDCLNFRANVFNFSSMDNDAYGDSPVSITNGVVTANTFNGDLSGTADTATCLADKSKGSAAQPVYINASGRPVACTCLVSSNVPSNAVFTDTKNTVGITTTTSKIYLVGATSTSTTTGASANSYTNASVFVSGNYLYSGGAKVLTAGDGDTKNTVGITTTASKIYLVGATSTSTTTGASAISYTNASVFISGNYLYSGGVQVKTADVNVTSTITSTSTYYLCGSTSSSNATGSLVKRSNVYVNASAYLNAVAFYETSDERLKDFSNKIDVDLDKISKIKKHRFTWKDSENKKEEIGVSSQEIRELYPEIVSENEEGYLSVAYDKLAVVALAAIDELHKKNKELEARIELLESKLLN